MTVKELKQLIKDWPEVDESTDEDCEVWLQTPDGYSNLATGARPLNKRVDEDGKMISADILFE